MSPVRHSIPRCVHTVRSLAIATACVLVNCRDCPQRDSRVHRPSHAQELASSTSDVLSIDHVDAQVRQPTMLISDGYILCRLGRIGGRCVSGIELAQHIDERSSLTFANITLQPHGSRTENSGSRYHESCTGNRSVCDRYQGVRRAFWPTTHLPNNETIVRIPYSSPDRGHHCLVDEETVHCDGSNDFGQVGVGANLPELARGRTRIPLLVTASVALGPDYTCVADRRGAVWCWGAFGNPPRRGESAVNSAQARATMVGSVTGADKIIATNCGPCALSGTRGRCWFSRTHRIADRAPTPEFSIPRSSTILFGGETHICASSEQVVQCASLGGSDGCDPVAPDIVGAPRVAIPPTATGLRLIGGLACASTIDGAGILCARVAEIERGRFPLGGPYAL
jgi:hypothetical protein